MKPKIENLKVYMIGRSTTGYQKALAMRELEQLLTYVAKLYQLRQPPVSGSLPPDELEKSLGSTNRQFTIWHDGGEWLISLKGKEHEQCKKLREWICGNDR